MIEAEVQIAVSDASLRARHAARNNSNVEVVLSPELLANPAVYLAYLALAEAVAEAQEPVRMYVKH